MKVVRMLTLLASLGVSPAQAPEPERLFNEAVAAQQRGDNAAAVEKYRELLKRNPGAEAAWVNMGIALVRLGQFDQAVASYQEALHLDPANAQARTNLGLAWYKKGDFANAAAQFEEIAKTNPSDAGVLTLLGECYLRQGDANRAVALLEPVAAAAGGNPDFAYVLGSARVASGKLQEGADLLERAARQTNAADAWLLAGDALLQLNLYERALADIEKAAELNPALAGVYTKLGTARERNADYAGAVQAYRNALQQNGNDLAALVGLGGVLYTLRDLEGARKVCERALKIDPNATDARYRLALVEKSDGHPQAALADFEAVAKVRPNWMPPHVELAALYFLLHRPEDGTRERQVVDQLAAAEQKAGP